LPLIVVDEVGYIPFDPEAANLMISLVSTRHERASMIVTSNKPFSRWGRPGAQRLRFSRVSAALPEHLHPADQLAREGKEDRDRHLMRLPFVAIALSHLNSRTFPVSEDALDLEHRQQRRGITQQTPDLIESDERV
jgi:hypothetical protein